LVMETLEAAEATTWVIWTLDSKFLALFILLAVFSFSASAYQTSIYDSGSSLDYFDSLESPQEVITGFVAPFLLIAVLFQRGYEKALSFSLAEDDHNQNPFTQSQERGKIKKTSLIMALATSALIVPTPWFQLIRQWVAVLFSMIGLLFFGGIFVAFVWILWKALS
jgi:hypothetical protein